MSFGKILRELREDHQITQEELGNILNVSKGNISKYELERLQPNIETLKILANYFNVSIDYLLGRSDIKNPTIETIALHRTDGYDEDLPDEALKEIESFKEFIRNKYKK